MRKLYLAIILVLTGTLLSMLTSCKEIQYVPVETIKTDSIYIVRERRDSVIMHDSVYMETYTKGDTIFQTKYKEFNVYIPRYITDTIVRYKTDSIPYPMEVIKPEPYVPASYKWLSGFAVLVILTTIIFILFKFFKK